VAGRPARLGRLLVECTGPLKEARVAVHASATDFDEGRQSLFLKRRSEGGVEAIYPMHGYFLDGGRSGIFMVHDGKTAQHHEQGLIDQTVNMGLLFFRTTTEGLRAVLNVYAENDTSPAGMNDFDEYSCRWADEPRRHSPDTAHVRVIPNSGATPPSHWYRESDRRLLSCTASPHGGDYRIEVLGSTIWPDHLAFLLLRAPDNEPVGYNVHLLEGPGRLLIHAHSYPHRTRVRMMDTMEETETVIGGLLLQATKNGYEGWIGLVSSAADPMNTSFSRDAAPADYSALGHAVIPPMRVACR
jgi:hypothetical protein